MPRVKRGRLMAVLSLTAAAALVGWWANRYRAVPLERAVSPDFWWKRLHGEDLYDRERHILFHGNRSRREVALTIDDGPNPEVGGRILDVLRGKGVRATFFVVGKLAKRNPELISRMAREGHEVGSHSQSHLRLDEMRPDQVARDLENCEINLFRAAGLRTNLLRPPGVRYNDAVVSASRARGYTLVSWTCTAADEAPGRSVSEIVDRLERRTENGSILLMHQNQPASAEALPLVIDRLRAQGFRFVTVSEMLERLPNPVQLPVRAATGNFQAQSSRTR